MKQGWLRAGCKADIPAMVALGARMHEKTGFDVEYEPNAAAQLMEKATEAGAVFVTRKGMIGGLETPLMYGTKPAFCTVCFWYSEDGMAWRLLDAFREWARLPVAVSTFDPRMKRVLERKGAELKEGVMVWP